MDIGSLGTNLSSGLNRPSSHDWNWLRRQVDQGRSLQDFGPQLSELLLGMRLEMGDLFEYRLALAEALQVLHKLREPLPPPADKILVPREKRTFQVGPIQWQSPPVISQGEIFCATPAQLFHNRKLLGIQRFLAEENEGMTHRVQFKLQAGSKMLKGGCDSIRLSRDGMDALQSGQDPPVKTLRLPPRFHRQVDFLRCASGQ